MKTVNRCIFSVLAVSLILSVAGCKSPLGEHISQRPAAPVLYTINESGAESAVLRWLKDDDVPSYKIYFQEKNSTSRSFAPASSWSYVPDTSKTDSRLNEAAVSSLKPNTEYVFLITAVNSSGRESEYSNSVEVLTKLETPVINKNSTESVTHYTVQLVWNSIPGADTYEVWTGNSGTTPDTRYAWDITETRRIVSVPDDNKAYFFWIKAFNSTTGNYSEFSSKGTPVVTKLRPPVLTIDSSTETSVSLSWEEVLGATAYDVYYITEDRFDVPDDQWMKVEDIQATNTDRGTTEITVGLKANTWYVFKIRAKTPNNESLFSEKIAGNTHISAPSEFKSVEITARSIKLSWKKLVDAYTLEYSKVSGSKTTISNINAGAWELLNLTENTQYDFWLKAIDASGTQSEPAQLTRFTLFGPPTGVGATADSDTEITVSWQPKIGSTGYQIETYTDAALLNRKGNPRQKNGDTSQDLKVDGLTAYTDYFFVVRALNDSPEARTANSEAMMVKGEPSASVSAKTKLGRPTGLTIKTPTADSVELTWDAVKTAEFKVYYHTADDFSQATLFTTGETITGTTATVTGLAEDTKYYFWLTAHTSTENSSESAPVIGYTLLNAPTGFKVNGYHDTSIDFTWDARTDGRVVSAYKIYAYTNASLTGLSIFKSYPGNLTSRSLENLKANTKYFFVVKAVSNIDPKNENESGPSNTVEAATLIGPPAGVTATPESKNSITVTWSVVNNAKYQVYHNTVDVPGNAVLVHSDYITGTTATVKGLEPDTEYYFWVTAHDKNTGAFSNKSPTSSISHHYTRLPAPVFISGTALDAERIALSWTYPDPGKVNGYTFEILYKPNSTWEYRRKDTLNDGSKTTHTVEGLEPNTLYKVVIRAVSTHSGVLKVESDPAESDPEGIKTPITAPKDLSAVPESANSFKLTWTGISNAWYSVYWSHTSNPADGGTAIDPSANFREPETTVTIPVGKAQPDTIYYFWVKAHAAGGLSSALSQYATSYTKHAALTGFGMKDGIRTTTSITLKWNPSSAAGLDHYVLRKKKSDENESAFTNVSNNISKDRHEYNVTGLDTAADYVFTITPVVKHDVTKVVGGAPTPLGNQLYEGMPATSGPIATLLATPLGLWTNRVSDSEIILGWTGVSGAYEYSVYYNTTGTAPTESTPGSVTHVTSASPTFGNLPSNTQHYFWVKAYKDTGAAGTTTHSEWSAAKDEWTKLPVVKNLTWISSTEDSVTLGWDTVPAATSYKILYRGAGGSFNDALGLITGSPHTVRPLPWPNTEYFFTIQGVVDGRDGVKSGEVTGRTTAVPKNVTASPLSKASIKVEWESVPDVDSYNIYRYPTDNPTAAGKIQSGVTETEITDSGLAEDTEYFYWVTAEVNSVESEKSGVSHTYTNLDKPSGVGAAALSASSIQLSWNHKNSPNAPWGEASKYIIELPNGTVDIPNGSSSYTYTANTLLANTSYTFNIRAVSPNSGLAGEAATPSATTWLATPVNIAATPNTHASINLTWGAVAGANSYTVFWKKTGDPDSNFTPISDITSPAYTFYDSGDGNQSYDFKVQAFNNAPNQSALSAVESGYTKFKKPENLTVGTRTANSIALSWNAPSGAPTTYRVKAYKTSDSSLVYTHDVTSGATSDTVNSGLASNTDYYITVQAVNTTESIEGMEENTSAKTLLETPVNLTVTKKLATSIKLSWTKVNGAGSYIVNSSTSSDFSANLTTGSVTAAAAGDPPMYTVTGLASNTTYWFRVVARDDGSNDSTASVSVLGKTISSNISISFANPNDPTLIGMPASINKYQQTDYTITVADDINLTGYTYQWRLDGVEKSTDSEYTIPHSTLSVGTHTLTLIVTKSGRPPLSHSIQFKVVTN